MVDNIVTAEEPFGDPLGSRTVRISRDLQWEGDK